MCVEKLEVSSLLALIKGFAAVFPLQIRYTLLNKLNEKKWKESPDNSIWLRKFDIFIFAQTKTFEP